MKENPSLYTLSITDMKCTPGQVLHSVTQVAWKQFVQEIANICKLIQLFVVEWIMET